MRIKKLVTLACILMCWGCDNKQGSNQPPEYPNIYFTEKQYQTGDTLWYVCYGTCSGNSVEELTFVLFEKGSIERPPGTRRVISRTISHKQGTKTIIDRVEGWLITDNPGKQMTQLPWVYQLNEIENNKLVFYNETVTLNQLKDFIESSPKQYTIAALLDFVN